MTKAYAAQALLLVIATVAPASAAPRQRPSVKPTSIAPAAGAATTFAQPVTFKSCQKVTSFACGMHDSAGRTFGTAHETTMCSTITLLPNGSFHQSGDLMSTTGTYRVVKRDVELRIAADGETPASTNTLTLNIAGTQLGTMTLVVASPDSVTP